MSNLTRWQLILGADKANGLQHDLSPEQQAYDKVLEALYDYNRGPFRYNPSSSKRSKKGSEASSQPAVTRWLGDVRTLFPKDVALLLQQDALQHPKLQEQFLLEPTLLEQATPDVHLLATLLELGSLLPEETKASAKRMVTQWVNELMAHLRMQVQHSVLGALNKLARQNRHPKPHEIDWNTTIKRNLKHYQPQYQTIIPHQLYGFGRKQKKQLKTLILCIDQSGSMASSLIYAGLLGAVLASLPSLKTHVVLYDTSVVDVTDQLHDPVELLLGVQLGGGTHTAKALRYCASCIQQPTDTILVLISDLYESGASYDKELHQQCLELKQAGVELITLLALNNDGVPDYDTTNAQYLADLQCPVLACTPDLFPELMAKVLNKENLHEWAGQHQIIIEKPHTIV